MQPTGCQSGVTQGLTEVVFPNEGLLSVSLATGQAAHHLTPFFLPHFLSLSLTPHLIIPLIPPKPSLSFF